jgi:hypothetical protein
MEYRIVKEKVYGAYCLYCDEYFLSHHKTGKVCTDCKVKGLKKRGYSEDVIRGVKLFGKVQLKLVGGKDGRSVKTDRSRKS